MSLPGQGLAPGKDAKLLRAMPVYGGRVVVRGPEGYCVDRSSHQRRAAGTLVFLASCESLSGRPGLRVDAALIVVTVTPRRPGTAQPTARDIAETMAPKRPLDLRDEDGIAMVHFNAGGAVALPGGDPHYWRGGMALNGHLVSLAVYGSKGSPIAGPAGRALLRSVALEMRRASPTPTSPARPATEASGTPPKNQAL